MVKMQTFLRNGDQQVGRYGYPDLRLDGVLAGAKEHLDAQMLLDPFEEQLHLPALAVQIGDQPWLEREVVGQEYHAFSSVVLDHYAPHRCGVILARKIARQNTGLVAQNRCIYRLRYSHGNADHCGIGID